MKVPFYGHVRQYESIKSEIDAKMQEVILSGWLYGKRGGGKIVFLQVRDGTGICQCVVEASCRYLDCSAADVTLSKGLGARHWAAAAISRATNAVAVTVSQSNGTVRIFQHGEVVLRIEPYLRRPMVWREFEYEPPVPEAKPKPKSDGAA